MTRGRRLGFAGFVVLAVGAAVTLVGCGESTPRGTAPSESEVSFAFGLARDQEGLETKVWDVSTPTSGQYTQFASLTSVADAYGATPEAVESTLETLENAGFAGAVDPTRGVITGTFAANEAEAFFGKPLDETTRSDGTAYISFRSQPEIPASLQPNVTEMFGGWATSQPDTRRNQSAPANTTDEADPPCPSPERGLQARAVIDDLYGLDPYYQASLTGEGVRVGMLSIEQHSPRALELFERCFDRKLPPVELTEVNAPANLLSGGNVETSMDLIFMGIIAPGIDTVEVFQFDRITSMVFPLADVLTAQNDSQQAIDILTTSVGFCASDLSAGERSMSDWLAMSLAASGVTFLASSGDYGSSSCYPPNEQMSNQYPSESAFATSVGGTMIAGLDSGTPSQVVWNETPRFELAGGGGPAATTPRPPYQSGLSGANVRQTPDVAFIAAPDDVGPIAYCNRGEPCDFDVVAGTSATAPGLAAVVAMLLEYTRTANPEQLLGLLNPAIYEFAQGPNYGDAFLDVTEGNNDVFGVGCCTATPGYDMASGWGSMRLDKFGELMVQALQRQ